MLEVFLLHLQRSLSVVRLKECHNENRNIYKKKNNKYAHLYLPCKDINRPLKSQTTDSWLVGSKRKMAAIGGESSDSGKQMAMDMCEVGSYYWTIRHVKMYMKSILVQHTVKGNEQLLFGKKNGLFCVWNTCNVSLHQSLKCFIVVTGDHNFLLLVYGLQRYLLKCYVLLSVVNYSELWI